MDAAAQATKDHLPSARRERRGGPLDPRLLHYARTTRHFLVLAVAIGGLTALLLIAQAWLIAHVVAGAFLNHRSLGSLRGSLLALLLVIAARSVLAWSAERAAHRASASAKSELRRATAEHVAALGTAIVKVFDLVVAVTGWNEKRLTSQGREFLAIHTHPKSHAGYYPHAQPMALKLLVDPRSGAILGAQGVGTEGVDKRIDVLATAIRAGLTAPELADLELAYAPPFGSAKDPVNMLGYIAENLLSGLVDTAQWSEVDSLRTRGAQFVDVRTAEEFARGSLPGAINIPLDQLRERFRELDAVDTVVNCEVGQRGYVATMLLNELGCRAVNLDGGYKTWHSSPAAVTLELIS